MTRPLRMAIEFRHKSWFDPVETSGVLQILRENGAAFVFAHSSRYPYPESEPVTADFVYRRFHGPDEMFASRYGIEKLGR